MYRTKKTKHSKTPLAVDFDGVIHIYGKGFLNGTIYDKPTAGVRAALKLLSKNYYLYIYSHRSKTKTGQKAVKEYMKKYRIPFDKIVAYKPPAKFYIDDRAIRFKSWKQTLRDLYAFEKELKDVKSSLFQPKSFSK